MQLQDCLRRAAEFIATDLAVFNEDVEAINALLRKVGVKRGLRTLRYEEKRELDELEKMATASLGATVQEIEKFQKDLSDIESETKRHTILLDKKAELERAARKSVGELTKLKAQRDRLEAIRHERRDEFRRLVETVLAQKGRYDEIIRKFAAQKADVLSDLDFSAQIEFDEERFLEDAGAVLDGRSVRVMPPRENGAEPSALQPILNVMREITSSRSDRVETLLQELEAAERSLRAKLKRSATNTVRDFYDCLYGNYLSVKPIVRYRNTKLEKLSLGQKATVLIKIYLAQDDRPIIIDSHDDHLDNEFIMEELVRAIRKAKTFRQVILVSNNGNVVVNSDAEQIIIASRGEEGEISYVSGSLESKEVRDQAIRILEGGEYAFRKRQEKYRMVASHEVHRS